MAVGDTYELVWQTQMEQRVFMQTFHYEQTVGSDVPETAAALCRTFSTWMLGTWVLMVVDALQFQCVTARRVLPSPDVPGVFFQPPDTKGAVAEDPLPAHNSVVVKLLTDNTNPKHNGRVFLNGLSEGDLDGGMYTALTMATKVANLRNRFDDTLVASGPDDQEWEPRVLNKFDSGVPIVPPTTSNIIGTSADALVYRQKRRLTRLTQVALPVI